MFVSLYVWNSQCGTLDVGCVTLDYLCLSGYKRSMNGWRKKIQCLPHIIMDAIILTVALFCTFLFECLRLLKCFYNIKVSQTKMVTVLLNEIVSFFLLFINSVIAIPFHFPFSFPFPLPFHFDSFLSPFCLVVCKITRCFGVFTVLFVFICILL